MNKRTYLDYGATTPIDDRVLSVILLHLEKTFGNPSSVHYLGQQSQTVLDESRKIMADLLGAQPKEIIFTSSGSESDNLALRGVAIARRNLINSNRILISPVEHPAVTNTALQLRELDGFSVETLPVDPTGRIQIDELEESLGEDVALVSIMAANNEIGTLNPLREIGSLCKRHHIPFHTDAVQYGAHYSLDVRDIPVDLISLGAHKFYGPKGVGALYVRDGTHLLPRLTGGSQEFGYRAATENVPLIVGMTKAFQLVRDEGPKRAAHLIPLRDRIIRYTLDNIPECKLTGGDLDQRLPNHASFVFKGVDGNLLIQVLDSEGFACSSGSACKTGDPKPSTVLTHLDYSSEWALGSLRITLGKDTTSVDIDRFLEILPDSIERVREVAR
jgi:cysteine desulfurase